MAFIPANLTARLTPIFSLPNNQRAVNTLHVVNGDGWNATSLQLLIDTYEEWFTEFLDTLMSNQVSLIGIDARDMSVQNGAVINYTPTSPLPGASTSNVMPGNVSACIAFKTGLAGRSFNGRVYHVGLTETMVSGDFVNAVTIDAIRDVYQELGDAIIALEWQHVVVSYVSEGVPRTSAVTTPITEYAVRTARVASQRRRLPVSWS